MVHTWKQNKLPGSLQCGYYSRATDELSLTNHIAAFSCQHCQPANQSMRM